MNVHVIATFTKNVFSGAAYLPINLIRDDIMTFPEVGSARADEAEEKWWEVFEVEERLNEADTSREQINRFEIGFHYR